MSKRYLGICDKLGKQPAGSAIAWCGGVGGAYGLNTLFNALSGRPDIFQNSYEVAVAAMLGCLLATVAHSEMNIYLSRKGISLIRGSKIAQRVQAAVFALPVVAALVFNAVSGIDKPENNAPGLKPVSAVHDPSRTAHSALAQSPSQFRLL